MDEARKEKELVGRYACRFVNDGQILGLGSGSTVAHFVRALGRKIKEEEITIHAIPTSYQIKFVAMKAGIPLTTLMEHRRIDVDIDGADEIDPELNLMKGASASAFTVEKIVAEASDRFIIIADHRKLVKRLGVRFPVPVEVLPDAHRIVAVKLEEMGAMTRLRTRADSSGLAQPLITENGNIVLEARFRDVADPEKTGMEIKSVTGVVEHGLFSGMADTVCVARKNKVRVMERGRQTSSDTVE
ncbi:MAG: ribose-5-phosphate isomerase RpiA [Nitrososphaeria archaeon]